ncbi:methyltransferase [Rhodoblastus sphagnicola]|uniref:Methyltransferase n=1 Tax=Rhodoblastus sphagnicola TaxID=333368 RepID=A0A2S6NCK1_9HYPH|nr:class I SAM-dependent methyltransferase [Rhodoblastus sphagnicola]MBB4199356.1 hypothetical protein [Rhodoblastus sphagnicola]PPQ32334.1 methyltransferase [Rhodoblastus sphagnicola]
MNALYQRISRCRIGGGANLVPVLDLGEQALTGVFPKSAEIPVGVAPLQLVWCADSGLVQLAHDFNDQAMFGDNYGYRSGLNASMVRHLQRKVAALESLVSLNAGDVVVDIGSNDATTLKSYSRAGLRKIGIDPTGAKFRAFYTDDIALVPDFFSAQAYRSVEPDRQARIVTSIAMFYDLPDPVDFARQVASILHDDGVWHLEQSYLPAMLRATSYDTICHEHLEYYSLAAMVRIMDAADLKVVDVTQNDINGGSFALTVAKKTNGACRVNRAVIDWMLGQEERMGLNTPKPYEAFAARARQHREDLRSLILALNGQGRKVLGYGASTKGNVTLQYCGFTAAEIPAIADVNPDKFGCVTPGSHIPIVSEVEAQAMAPDYFLVLPWHFRENILSREQEFRNRGGRFIFPFPDIEIV